MWDYCIREYYMTKICTYCKLEKELEEFNRQKRGQHGRTARCKSCLKALIPANYHKNYYLKNKKNFSTKSKEYYQVNKEKILLNVKAYAKLNPGCK